MTDMKFKSRLTLRAMILWEQMTGRSFSEVDFSNAEDVRRVQYCSCVAYADEPFTFREFVAMLESRRLAASAARAVARYNDFVSQFISAKNAHADENGGRITLPNMGQIAARLIAHGMDAHFVLDEMTVADLPLYLSAIDDIFKQQQESQRLWTFYSIMPHVDVKKLRSPQHLCRFPWEKHDASEQERELAKKEFMDFMNGKIKFNNGRKQS